MELELKLENRLSAYVALTVVIISVFMAICQVKDENLIELMMHSDAKAVDTLNEYQAERIRLNTDRNDAAILKAHAGIAGMDAAATSAEITRLNRTAAQYEKSSAELLREARSYEKAYEAAELRNSQFDITAALCAIALALSAVAALINYLPLLFAAWGIGGFGMIVGIAAIASWNFHPEFLASWLG
jgi:anaerobic C4-dicarboxylate transporter